jgi:hypothetical protein
VLRKLYLVSATLLLVHEIDAAYWREWELFRLPGGVEGFLALHLALVAATVWGYGQVVVGARSGLWLSLALSAAGLLAPLLHSVFLLQGRPEFRSWGSVSVLLAAGLASAALAAVAANAWRRERGAPGVAALRSP